MKKSRILSQTFSSIELATLRKNLRIGWAIGHATLTVATNIKLVTTNTAAERKPPTRIAAKPTTTVTAPSSATTLLDMEDATG
jgi:uncharacterized protein (DUF736 family)